jgi:hypothetical protein
MRHFPNLHNCLHLVPNRSAECASAFGVIAQSIAQILSHPVMAFGCG